MNTHYIPQCILAKFRDESLYELDKASGNIERRNPKSGGSDHDLWSATLERHLMERHDTAAAGILRRSVWGRTTSGKVLLPGDQRLALAKWLALFVPRVPAGYLRAKSFFKAEVTVETAENMIRSNPDACIDHLIKQDPASSQVILETLGREAGRLWILGIAIEQVRSGAVLARLTPQTIYEGHLASMEHHLGAWGLRLSSMHWRWYYTNQEFIIGDNPLCRFNPRNDHWDFGIGRKGVEITFPVSRKLCLFIERTPSRDNGNVLLCGRARTKEFNRRQLLSATRLVYASKPWLLNPDARDGFY